MGLIEDAKIIQQRPDRAPVCGDMVHRDLQQVVDARTGEQADAEDRTRLQVVRRPVLGVDRRAQFFFIPAGGIHDGEGHSGIAHNLPGGIVNKPVGGAEAFVPVDERLKAARSASVLTVERMRRPNPRL